MPGFSSRARYAFALPLLISGLFLSTAHAARPGADVPSRHEARRSVSLDFDRDGRTDKVRIDAAGRAVFVRLEREGAQEVRYAVPSAPVSVAIGERLGCSAARALFLSRRGGGRLAARTRGGGAAMKRHAIEG